MPVLPGRTGASVRPAGGRRRYERRRHGRAVRRTGGELLRRSCMNEEIVWYNRLKGQHDGKLQLLPFEEVE